MSDKFVIKDINGNLLLDAILLDFSYSRIYEYKVSTAHIQSDEVQPESIMGMSEYIIETSGKWFYATIYRTSTKNGKTFIEFDVNSVPKEITN